MRIGKEERRIGIHLLLDLACFVYFSWLIKDAVARGSVFGVVFWGLFLVMCVISIRNDGRKLMCFLGKDKAEEKD